MKTRIGFGLLLLSTVLVACGSYNAMTNVRDDLMDAIKQYNELVRVKDFEKARQYVAESARDEFDARVQLAKDVKISEYRILKREFITTTDEEIVKVEVNYTIPPSAQTKTLLDEQNWSFLYVREEGGKRWRLITPFPEFK
jgi:hypothetical protein